MKAPAPATGMQPKARSLGRRDTPRDTSVRDANFYALPFASQMIVWAMRKRLNALCESRTGVDDVLQVFHMANWGELYAALLTVVDIFVGADLRGKLLLHEVSCPCLAPHEAHLLNALAHVQHGRRDEAILSLCEIVAPAGARVAMLHLGTIVAGVNAQSSSFVHVDLSTVTPQSQPRTRTKRRIRSVH